MLKSLVLISLILNLVGVNLLQSAHVARHSVQLPDEHRQSGVVLLGEDGEQFGQFSERHVLGGEGDFGLGCGRGLDVDLAVDQIEQVLDLFAELH